MSHFSKKCPKCKDIWSRCRCMGPKETIKELCPDCKAVDERKKAAKTTR